MKLIVNIPRAGDMGNEEVNSLPMIKLQINTGCFQGTIESIRPSAPARRTSSVCSRRRRRTVFPGRVTRAPHTCAVHTPARLIMNAQLTMDNIGDLHGVSHDPVSVAADLMTGSPHHRGPVAHRSNHLAAHPRSMGMASILDGGEYHHHHHRPPDHALTGALHPTMTMACDTPPGMSMSSTYTTLTPLQPLPPISTVSDKFPHHHHHHHHPPPADTGQCQRQLHPHAG
ncbi:unnamed protein product [Ranitomeya imitator]|uniref:Uncharacterized protein n=1 Tax=Ranitomeya imitator TaxID=111125 RepID=A0ABN9LHV9_9NEOB|nr:unnamed protein product [Ranitomeya imitator]